MSKSTEFLETLPSPLFWGAEANSLRRVNLSPAVGSNNRLDDRWRIMTLSDLKAGLKDGSLVLELSTWGDGMHGVGLYRKGHDIPLERIAIEHWHCEQDDEIIYADKDDAPGWFYNVFQAGELSNKARTYLVDFCKLYEDIIMDYINGEYELELPKIKLV